MKRKKTSYKGQSGYVLVVGGSREYTGAVALAGIAALRAGCDLVTIAAPEKVAWAINKLSPDLITHKVKCDYFLPKHVNEIVKLSKKFDVVLLGNGISLKSKAFCKQLNKKIKKPKVIDADALKAIRLQDTNNAILTPHAKELKILLKNSGSTQIQKIIGNNVILIKGAHDHIISKTKNKKITGGNPGMAKAGTGDVLAGLCAGFLAQTNDLFKSAEAASTLNKKIGDLLLKKKGGYSFIASDMVEEIRRFR